MRRRRIKIKKAIVTIGGLVTASALIAIVAFLVIFQESQRSIAFTLASGIGMTELQIKVDRIEKSVVEGRELTEAERAFLRDIYSCFAKGGKVSRVAIQSADMMTRYLSATGEDLQTDPRIFLRSSPVQQEMENIRTRIIDDLKNGRGVETAHRSAEFYMGDPDYFDAAVGLYFGHVTARVSVHQDGMRVIAWRAECPWTWPSYDELYQQYGRHGAQRFAIPNAKAVLTGRRDDCLLIGDGLGGHLAEIGLAKPFLVYSEWSEEIHLGDDK